MNSIKDEIKDDKSDHKLPEDLNRRKVFVGNVPFNCTQEEFDQCFENVSGIYKADIVRGHKDISRGIGFVTMNTVDGADLLRRRTDIKCKGRALRFYAYQNNTCKGTMENVNNYVFIDGIPEDKNRAWLLEAFKPYGPFNRCFVAVNHETGEKRTTGFLDVVDDNKYERIVSNKYHTIVDSEDESVTLTITKYRQKAIIKAKPRRGAKKEQLMSAMIIDEHRGHARERSGKRFRKFC